MKDNSLTKKAYMLPQQFHIGQNGDTYEIELYNPTQEDVLARIDLNQINQSTVRWLKGRYKNLSEAKIIERANKITKKYLEKNKEKLEKQAKLDQARFEEEIDKEFLYLKLFGPN